MARSSPGVHRVAAVLNFMADHPGQSFALTDLVRALKLSRATCHALLTGLVEVGYLYRTSDKSYVLGPALVAIGKSAAKHFSPLQVAQPEMRALADEFDVICAAYFLEGDMVHLRERAASISHVGYPVPMGTRTKLRSAQAACFFAHAPEAAEAWLRSAVPPPSAENRERMQQGMGFVRENGFLALVRHPSLTEFDMPVSSIVRAETDDLPVMPVGAIDDAAAYPLAALMAPVFDARGKVDFCLLLAGFHFALTGAQMRETGAKLTAACARISAFLAG